MSVLLRPVLPAAAGGQIGFVAGLAVAETLAQRVDGARIALKWPNDVLVDGRKIAGLLPEAVVQGDHLSHIVLGIGVNLASSPDTDMRWPATALADHGEGGCEPVDFAAGLTRRLARWLEIWLRDGFEPVRAAWMGRAWGLGRAFRTEEGGEAVTGRFDGIDEDGALVLAAAGGSRRIVRSGEISPTGPA
jgi:BirA family biotin operon repressor/biotin-[acetyl-CoA-carboxylase] ligase